VGGGGDARAPAARRGSHQTIRQPKKIHRNSADRPRLRRHRNPPHRLAAAARSAFEYDGGKVWPNRGTVGLAILFTLSLLLGLQYFNGTTHAPLAFGGRAAMPTFVAAATARPSGTPP